ncbi:hypothetical protein ACTOB_001954 [Actinoplanes oblitus]|uniref:HTH marR-type domain-containing protein n=1 Tax=Actinoplanes oblitus TaxID=3040509 RepID=A0ABY8WMV0_9ACTN|nr:hypothetical protein [Actinoplanes oblitus]WIM98356.1 hypothetical protein ACTOB_001954 [Actinoplanes oblitus]
MTSGDLAAVVSRRRTNVVFTAILLAALDQTIVSTALPTIVADLGGALFSDKLATFPAIANPAAASPAALHRLDAAVAEPIIQAYADTIAYVFRWVVPVAVLGFLVAWFLKELPLRDGARSHATDVGEGFPSPAPTDRVTQLERAISDTMRKAGHDRTVLDEILADSGGRLSPGQAWAMGQTHLHTRARGAAELPAIARSHRLPAEVLRPTFTDLCQAGYAHLDGDVVRLTPAGQEQFDRVRRAWRDWLEARLEDFTMTDPGDRALLDQALSTIATRLVDEPAPAGSPGRA